MQKWPSNSEELFQRIKDYEGNGEVSRSHESPVEDEDLSY